MQHSCRVSSSRSRQRQLSGYCELRQHVIDRSHVLRLHLFGPHDALLNKIGECVVDFIDDDHRGSNVTGKVDQAVSERPQWIPRSIHECGAKINAQNDFPLSERSLRPLGLKTLL